MSKKKKNLYVRGISSVELYRRAVNHKIFDDISYDWREGQPGVYFWIVRNKFYAFLCRSSIPIDFEEGPDAAYNATRQNPTRLTSISISKLESNNMLAKHTQEIGKYDSSQRAYKADHKFEKDAKKDPELKRFLEDILNIFNSAKCPLSKK